MSIDTFVALSGPLPDVAKLGDRLRARGGAVGSWEGEVTSGGVAMYVAPDLVSVVEGMLAAAKKKISVAHVVVIAGGSFDDVDDLGHALAAGGGAIVNEDGDVLVVRRARSR